MSSVVDDFQSALRADFAHEAWQRLHIRRRVESRRRAAYLIVFLVHTDGASALGLRQVRADLEQRHRHALGAQ